MEFSSIIHEPTNRFAFSISKNNFLFRIKTKKNDIKKIIFHSQDKYLPLSMVDSKNQKEMQKFASDSYFDYWEVNLKFKVICLRYFFELTDFEGKTEFLGNIDFYEEEITDVDLMFDCPENSREEEIFTVPEWAKNKIVYQIFSSRFASSTPIDKKIWYKQNLDGKENFHGDLKGITQNLEYIKDLGVDAIYLTPIFKSSSIHKYDTEDYFQIDPTLGTNEDFKNLVQKAHSLGLKIILDAVFNHTSRDFFAFADIIKNKEKSKYKDWYYIEKFPVSPKFTEDFPNFQTFGYFAGMPKTNLNNPETRKYFLDVATFWIKEYDIDGWRLDVADEILHDFWQDFRKAVRKVKNDILITGECWHFTPDYLDGTKWDNAMNYLFYNAVRSFVACETISATKFVETLNFIKGNYHPFVYQTLWNHLDSHDTPRFLYQAQESKQKLHLAAAFQFLLPGMPFIYYGDEVGLTGGADPDCRRGMIWEKSAQDEKMLSWYKSLIKTRKQNPIITEGKTVETKIDDETKTIVIKKCLEEKSAFIIFCASKDFTKSEITKDFIGKTDLITATTFDGNLSMDAKVFLTI